MPKNSDFEEFLTECEPYKNNNTTVYFYDKYEAKGKFSDSQWKKLCVKKKKDDETGIYHKHRILYKNIFNENPNPKILTIIMFNPSTADHFSNDPTINNCIKIAKDNDYDGIEIINMLTIRTPDVKSAMDDRESSVISCSSYSDYLKNKDILIAWGGISKLNKDKAQRKLKLHEEFVIELEKNSNENIYTYSNKLVDNCFPRHPSPQSFNKALKENKVDNKNSKIQLKKYNEV